MTIQPFENNKVTGVVGMQGRRKEIGKILSHESKGILIIVWAHMSRTVRKELGKG